MTEAPDNNPEQDGPNLNDRGKATVELLKKSLAQFQFPSITSSGGDPVLTVAVGDILKVGRICKDDPHLDFKLLHCLSVVDFEDHFQVVYHLYSLNKQHKTVLKVDLPHDDPRIPSMVPIWKGANWYEREGHDLFGVVFEGHPNLEPLILYEGFEGYPGRKSFPFHDYNEW